MTDNYVSHCNIISLPTSSVFLNHWNCTCDAPTAQQLRRRLCPAMTATDCGWTRIWIPVKSIQKTSYETALEMQINHLWLYLHGIYAKNFCRIWMHVIYEVVCLLNILAKVIMLPVTNKSVKVRPLLREFLQAKSRHFNSNSCDQEFRVRSKVHTSIHYWQQSFFPAKFWWNCVTTP